MRSGSLLNLGLKYTVFAIIAISVNIFFQELTYNIYTGPFALEASMVCGVFVGFLTKYYLDRKYIFFYRFISLRDDFKILFLYILMSGLSTLIFWAFELSFDWLFEARYMRYVGAIIGLSIGYGLKYILDKQFVFVRGD